VHGCVCPSYLQLLELAHLGTVGKVAVSTVHPLSASAPAAFATALTRLDNDLTKIVIGLDCLEVEGEARALRWEGAARAATPSPQSGPRFARCRSVCSGVTAWRV
jgi:hypothetical protein